MTVRSIRALLLAAAALALGSADARPVAMPDVIIRGGTIYTGADTPPMIGEVALTGDRIVYVGPVRTMPAREIVDARGKIVAPGFIDAHAHPDTYIRSPDPTARLNVPWLTQGVSTLVIGVDGFGTPDVKADVAGLERAGIGTNLVPYVGFGAIRGRVLGAGARAPDAAELARMKTMVAAAMCDGATGFSTGLFYPPQSFAKTEEVIALAREAAIRGGMYDTHQRDESSYTIGLFASIDETLRIGREAGMPVHFAHLKALGVDMQGQAPRVIAMIDRARAAGQEVTADQYPWLASGSSVDASLVPSWAVDGGYKAMIARFADPQVMAKLRPEMVENLRRRGGADAILLTADGFPWTGRTLAAMAAQWKLTPIDAAIRILRELRPSPEGPIGANIASFNMIDADVDAIMKQPWVVTSSDGSDGHPRQYATFPEKYRVYVRQRHVIDLANFIRHSTGLTADIYKIDHRGYLRPGYHADVVVFDPATYTPRADYLHPTRLSVGVDRLFVNGRLALKDGVATGVAAGRGLLRATPAHCPATP